MSAGDAPAHENRATVGEADRSFDQDAIFAALADNVDEVVLCGNRNRAERWRDGNPHEPLGEMNRYAAREGMTELLARHGYSIVSELTEGDEIVVGRILDRPGKD